MKYRVAELLVDALAAHGIGRAYSVPGESFLALLDALHKEDRIDLVTCRHEGSAALAAIADAKLTGKPGVVMVSRGPGAFNAALGLHVAEQEAIPLILLIGQVNTPNLGRDAVQEIDSRRSFAGTIKWSGRIESADKASEIMARAFAAAMTGTPGPVVVELPEDVLEQSAGNFRCRVHGIGIAAAAADDVSEAARLLSFARRPVLIVGGECRTEGFRHDLRRLSDMRRLPVAATNKNQDQFPNDHPHWVGQLGFFGAPAHLRFLERADLVLAVGTRLGDVSSLGFKIPQQTPTAQTLIHVYPDAQAIGRHFETALPIVSSAHSFVRQLLSHVPDAYPEATWLAEAENASAATHGWNRETVPDADVLGHAIGLIADHLEPTGIVTTDSGNFAGWVHRILRFGTGNRLLGSACGAMGSGVPSGLSACLHYPQRQVIAFCGDGGFLMNGNELATVVARNLKLKIIVSNNASYGTIRSHQEHAYPARQSGTDLRNPDIAAMARAFGAKGFTIKSKEDAMALIPEAMNTTGPAVIEIQSHVEMTLAKSLSLAAQR